MLFLLLSLLLAGGASARWRCEPAEVAVGEPFELVLELTHADGTAPLSLLQGEPAFDDSWVVLARRPVRELARQEGEVTSAISWSVAALEPGTRALSSALSSVSFAEPVSSIQVGGAEIVVRGVLADGEDAPRPLREFERGFAGEDAGAGGGFSFWWLGALVPLLAGAAFVLLRRRRKGAPVTARGPLAELDALERGIDEGRGRECVYELTRLVRQAYDALRARPRPGLTDEEWLVELRGALEVPSGAVEAAAAVLARTEAVKYRGVLATPWALHETFALARAALAALAAAPAPAGPTQEVAA